MSDVCGCLGDGRCCELPRNRVRRTSMRRHYLSSRRGGSLRSSATTPCPSPCFHPHSRWAPYSEKKYIMRSGLVRTNGRCCNLRIGLSAPLRRVDQVRNLRSHPKDPKRSDTHRSRTSRSRRALSGSSPPPAILLWLRSFL